MMKECFIDVHCHLDMCENIKKIIENSRENNVGIIITQGVSFESNRKVLELAEKYPEVKAALGIYPIDALALKDDEINDEIDFIRKNKDKIAAIGEVGLDFKEGQDFQRQKEIFKKFVKLSISLNIPIIVHSRKAEEECIRILEELKAKKVVMHCFSGKFKLVEQIAENEWFLSIPGNVKHSQQFQNIAEKINIKNLLCETDSPYLHPEKKWLNEPANVIESYKKIAELKSLNLKEVKAKICGNYLALFGGK